MKILYTSDGSERSRAALPHAARLAQASGSKLNALRVLDRRMDLGGELATSVKKASDTVASQWTEALLAEAKEAGLTVEPIVEPKRRREDTAAAVLRVAEAEDASVVVMATRGSGALRHALLGSVAMTVLGHSEIPVMLTGERIAPPRGGEQPYHVLITTDGSAASAAVWPAFRRVFRRAGGHDIKVTLLRIHAPATGDARTELGTLDAEWQLAQFRRSLPRRLEAESLVRTIETLGGVDSAILTAAEETGADTIWMASHGHSLRRHLLAGSVALGVVSRSPVPVTLVRVD
ncbi:MAG: universal stress protein [Dehalococcoidia bacterium]